ncbi:ParA family protein [Fimbriiglobus ruber]|uniref:Chromosome (Plasmid) partitioning protein ParA / Sporulation initiation inhibitor protein Soj n=1 Tax=Fimbriiglobus ruber TaxID=1908690 RepID=A0A225DEP1_9BACT|nr:ParA family protein [Fimbriiglobus ruber]OWK35619.1 Chromosome (plasmid) partitioning protein ParA / Sporulation initiation inhibitor protein Soj [Fimbriiglobus ruber]
MKEGWEFLRDKRREMFSRWLKANYDFILVDCPPAIAWQVRFFLLVADGYIVPTIPDRLSVRGARYLCRRLHNIKVKTRPLGLLWSMKREIQTHSEFVETIRTGRERMKFELPDDLNLPAPFNTVIPHAVAITRGQTGTEPYVSFRDKYETGPAKLFADLCQEIIFRIKREKSPASREAAFAKS